MTPAQAKAMYRRQIAANGETITLRKINTSPAPPTDASVRAKVIEQEPDELTGGLNQVRRTFIVLEEDVAAAAFPVPFLTAGTHKVVWMGKTLNIQQAKFRRVGDETIAYQLETLGA